jgi:Pectate lyase superfamily protein
MQITRSRSVHAVSPTAEYFYGINSKNQTVAVSAADVRGVVSVKDYGATGDGVTDDTAAVIAAQAALVAAGGGDLLFPTGTYIMGSRLPVESNVTLRATGLVTLKAKDGVDLTIWAPSLQSTTPAKTSVGAIGITFDGNRANALLSNATSVVALDPIDGGYFERCVFKSASGYGVSLQYAVSTPDNERVKNLTFVKCDFTDNGFGVGGTEYDGIDIKNCDGVTFTDCRAFANALDGFDIRGKNLSFHECQGFDNGGSGMQIAANANGVTQETSVRVYGGVYRDNEYGIYITNNPAGGAGATQVDFFGPVCHSNTQSGVVFDPSNANTRAIGSLRSNNNGQHGIRILGNVLSVDLSTIECNGNTSSGVYANGEGLRITSGSLRSNGAYGIEEGASARRNIYSGSMRIADNTTGAAVINASSYISPEVTDFNRNSSSAPGDNIASAATLTLPVGGAFFTITGTTGITSIAAAHRGRQVTLAFSEVLTVTDGGNIALASNFTTSSGDTLTLVCDGSSWLEIARSVN